MTKKYMHKTKWVVFDNTGKRLKTVTLKHIDGKLYRELDPFHEELKSKGLSAHCYESLNQDYLKGKTFIEKLKILGWNFDNNGFIID